MSPTRQQSVGWRRRRPPPTRSAPSLPKVSCRYSNRLAARAPTGAFVQSGHAAPWWFVLGCGNFVQGSTSNSRIDRANRPKLTLGLDTLWTRTPRTTAGVHSDIPVHGQEGSEVCHKQPDAKIRRPNVLSRRGRATVAVVTPPGVADCSYLVHDKLRRQGTTRIWTTLPVKFVLINRSSHCRVQGYMHDDLHGQVIRPRSIGDSRRAARSSSVRCFRLSHPIHAGDHPRSGRCAFISAIRSHMKS